MPAAVLHSPDPGSGAGGREPRLSETELERELAEYRRTEEALARRTAELEEARNFLDSVLEHLPVMLFVKDAEHLRFVRWNRAEEEALGIDRSVAIGKSDYDFFPDEQAQVLRGQGSRGADWRPDGGHPGRSDPDRPSRAALSPHHQGAGPRRRRHAEVSGRHLRGHHGAQARAGGAGAGPRAGSRDRLQDPADAAARAAAPGSARACAPRR